MINGIFKTLHATTMRELKRMVSRPIYFIALVLVMAFCYVFFLTFFDNGQPDKMPIGVVDLDNSSLSRQFVHNVSATQLSKITMRLGSHKEAREEMQRGNIYAFVEIERDFQKKTIANKRPVIGIYTNDAYLVAGSLLSKDLMYMSALSSGAVQRQILRAKGIEESRIMGIIQPIVINTHLIGNPMANYGVYLLNVLLPGVLQLMVLMMTIFSVGVEFKERTSLLWLEQADNSIQLAIIGKLAPYTLVFSLVGMIGNILLYGYMHYPLNAAIGWMFLNTIMLVTASQSVGLLLIGITPVLRDGVTLAAFYGLLGFTFAGFTFPIEQMPPSTRIFSYLFPIRHYFNIYVDQALNGLHIAKSAYSFLALGCFNLLPIIVLSRLKNAALTKVFPIK